MSISQHKVIQRVAMGDAYFSKTPEFTDSYCNRKYYTFLECDWFKRLCIFN